MIASLILSALATATGESGRITIDDIEARFRELTGSATSTVESARSTVVRGAVAGGVLLLVFLYLLGRRHGRQRATVLEIRRIV